MNLHPMNFRRYPVPNRPQPEEKRMALAVKPDRRTQPGAYLTRNRRLYENVGPERDESGELTGLLLLEDCANLHRVAVAADEVITWYDLVREAPGCPDFVDLAA